MSGKYLHGYEKLLGVLGKHALTQSSPGEYQSWFSVVQSNNLLSLPCDLAIVFLNLNQLRLQDLKVLSRHLNWGA